MLVGMVITYELRNRSIGMLYLYPNLTAILLQVESASL